MADVVYITGGKSAWNENELRYSLRSLVKHLKNIGRVFVVGPKPAWLTGVIHIPADDMPTMKKEPRLAVKRHKACQDARISETALFIYDDEYLLEPHDADNFPYYYSGDLALYHSRLQKKGHHKSCTANTIQALEGNNLNTRLYDIHVPMLCNKTMFLSVLRMYDWVGMKDGFLIKSTYANTMGVEGRETIDTKINHPDATLEEYKAMIACKYFFSTGDNCNWTALEQLMEELYPEPCHYELKIAEAV